MLNEELTREEIDVLGRLGGRPFLFASNPDSTIGVRFASHGTRHAKCCSCEILH